MLDGQLPVVLSVVAALAFAAFAVWIAWKVVNATWWGALLLLMFASAQGFIGMAVYLACWVFMLPIMLVVCFLIGGWLLLIAWLDERDDRKRERLVRLGDKLIGRAG